MKVAAFTLIILSLFTMRNVLALSGTDIGLSKKSDIENQEPPVSEATIQFLETTYSPSSITVKAGTDVRLNLSNVSGGGCIQAFTIPKLGVQKIVAIGTQEVIQFTAPSKPQQMEFMCSMGMYRGVINVI